MNRIEYLIKDKNNFPRIIAEVIADDELLTEYEINLSEDISMIDILLIKQYSERLAELFERTILEIKNNGFNSNAFEIRIAPISEILRVKTQCDEYFERMDIIE
jgi:hypothetical protein